MKKYGLLLVAVTLGFAENVTTEDKVDPLENWWLKSALEHPKSESILSHYEVQGMLSQSEGNYKADSVLINTSAYFRKNEYTLNLATKNSNTKQEINQDPANKFIFENEEEKYYVTLNYALSPKYYLTLGGFTERDSVMSVDKRETYYFGVGGHPIQTKNHQLQMFAAVGRDNIEYYKANSPAAVSNAFTALAPGGDSNALYIQEKYHWTINNYFSIDQSLNYFFEELENRDNGAFMAALNYQLHKNVALTLKYDVKYSEVLDGAIKALDPHNISTTDKTTSMNISFNY